MFKKAVTKLARLLSVKGGNSGKNLITTIRSSHWVKVVVTMFVDKSIILESIQLSIVCPHHSPLPNLLSKRKAVAVLCLLYLFVPKSCCIKFDVSSS